MDLYIQKLNYLLNSPFGIIFIGYPWLFLFMFKIKKLTGEYIYALKSIFWFIYTSCLEFFFTLCNAVIYLFLCGGKGLKGCVIGVLLVTKLTGLFILKVIVKSVKNLI